MSEPSGRQEAILDHVCETPPKGSKRRAKRSRTYSSTTMLTYSSNHHACQCSSMPVGMAGQACNSSHVQQQSHWSNCYSSCSLHHCHMHAMSRFNCMRQQSAAWCCQILQCCNGCAALQGQSHNKLPNQPAAACCTTCIHQVMLHAAIILSSQRRLMPCQNPVQSHPAQH
jgi:hypothetical protein